MPLDSDISNPDANLHVEFFTWSMDDQYKGKEFVRIKVPGDQTLVVEQPLGDHHKARFPRQWAAYKLRQTGEIPFGTQLETWAEERPSDINAKQITELNYMGFQNVEQLAAAGDGAIQKIGIGGEAIREKARRYLAYKRSPVDSEDLANTKAQLAALQEQMAQLMAAKTGTIAVEVTGAGSRGGGTMTPAERMAIARAARGKGKVTDGQHAAPVGDASHL